MFKEEKLFGYFSQQMRFTRQANAFKQLLYILVLIKSIFWLSQYALYFGEASIIYTKPFNNLGFIQQAAYLLHQMNSNSAALFFIIPVLLIALAGLFKLRIAVFTDLLLWFLVLNIHNRIYSTMSGGEILMDQLLFFNAFLWYSPVSSRALSAYQIILHNFGSLAVITQVCFVYIFSALAKIQNDSWMNGTAVLETLQIAHYSTPFLSRTVVSFPWLFIVLNYLVLLYQLLFPLLVWVNKIKKPFITIGILMHLFIIFGMGLVTFGAVMILSYIYFWPVKEKSRI